MKQRRNENESAESLIHYGFRFEKINILLQKGIYERFKEYEYNNYSVPNTLCHAVMYCPFQNVSITNSFGL